jgi:predicted CXXCH cytochrome family protein
MKTTIKNSAAQRLVAVAFLTATVVTNFAGTAGAFSSASSSSTTSQETCAFTLQLQKSVAARKQYLVEIEGSVSGSAQAKNSVEAMYDNIQPASYEAGNDTTFSAKKSVSTQGLDAFSANCLSCHDGANASLIEVTVRNQPGTRTQLESFTSEHPIGMQYNSYVAADRGYNAIPANTTMIFSNGRVGCLTCHNPLNTDKGHLVMSDAKSALCYTCHNK